MSRKSTFSTQQHSRDPTSILTASWIPKSTSKKQCVTKAASTPNTHSREIFHSQLLRFHRICSRTSDRDKATQILFKALRQRSYSRSFLRQTRKRAFIKTGGKLPPTTRDHQSTQQPQIVVPLVSVYSSNSTQLHQTLKRNFQTIMEQTQPSNMLKIISAYKKNPNLQDLLVRAKLPKIRSIPTQPTGPRVVSNKHNHTRFLLPKGLTLSSVNCVYLIYCRTCNQQYVGETRNSLRTRLHAHKHNIKRGRKTDTALVQHFQRHGLNNLRMIGLENYAGWTHQQR